MQRMRQLIFVLVALAAVLSAAGSHDLGIRGPRFGLGRREEDGCP